WYRPNNVRGAQRSDPKTRALRSRESRKPQNEVQMTTIDHLILKINDVPASVDFYVEVMGFQLEGEQPPFTVIRVSDDFVMQLAPWGTEGNEHLAFSLSRESFDVIFARVREKGIPYGESFHSVGANTGPGVEFGAKGAAPTLYFNDPNKHLIEIRTYD
ncbi:MAG: VOC family protein, partial [Acidobacteriota bacterium]